MPANLMPVAFDLRLREDTTLPSMARISDPVSRAPTLALGNPTFAVICDYLLAILAVIAGRRSELLLALTTGCLCIRRVN
jgi:hypothetical protein